MRTKEEIEEKIREYNSYPDIYFVTTVEGYNETLEDVFSEIKTENTLQEFAKWLLNE